MSRLSSSSFVPRPPSIVCQHVKSRRCSGAYVSYLFTQHHLLNPRACSAYLWSEDAARSQDPETQALLSNLLCAGGDPRQATRRCSVSAPEPVAASAFHARAPAPHHPPCSPPAIQPDLGLLQRLSESGRAESLLVALNRRCDTLEAQNSLLRSKVQQLYPPGAHCGDCCKLLPHGLHVPVHHGGGGMLGRGLLMRPTV